MSGRGAALRPIFSGKQVRFRGLGTLPGIWRVEYGSIRQGFYPDSADDIFPPVKIGGGAELQLPEAA